MKLSNLSRKKRAIHLQVKGHALVIAVFSFQSYWSCLILLVSLAEPVLCQVARELNLWSSTQGSSLLVMREGPISQKLRQAPGALSFFVQDCHAKLMLQYVGQHVELDIVT